MSRKSVLQRVSLSLALITLIAVASPAAAEDRPFYVEANIGRVSVDDIDGFSLSETSTAFRLGTGYSFLPWLGIAGAFVDLGTIESTVDIGSGAPVPVTASATGFEVTLACCVPLGDAFAFTADAGVLWWTGDSSVDGVSSSDSGNDFTWGVGAEYALAGIRSDGRLASLYRRRRRCRRDLVGCNAAIWRCAIELRCDCAPGAEVNSFEAHADKRLVERMLAGDDVAFRTFFSTYFPRLFRFALYRLRGDEALAEDVAQNTMGKAMDKLDTYRGEAALYSWLCTFVATRSAR